jgi:hypothetical protein
MKRLIFVLLLLLVAPSVAAQQDSIRWTIVPGFNGTFKFGAWVPVTITVENTGNDLRGKLEWRWENSNSRYSQSIDLPRGANKRVVLPVVADAFGGNAVVRLYNSEREVVRQVVRYNQADVSSLVVGVLSDTSNALADLSGLPSAMGVGTTLVRLESATLPDRWELLQSLDMLFVHDTDTTLWSE